MHRKSLCVLKQKNSFLVGQIHIQIEHSTASKNDSADIHLLTWKEAYDIGRGKHYRMSDVFHYYQNLL